LSNIISIATKAGKHKISEEEMRDYMIHAFEDEDIKRKIKFLFREASIQTKYSVIPDFTKGEEKCQLFNSNSNEAYTHERLAIFKEKALELSLDVSNDVLNKAHKSTKDVTDIITVSCTGMHAPGLETELAMALELSPSTNRHAVNFMGCYAAFHAFRLADLICKSNPDAQVLMVCVELCTLHFRKEQSDDNLLATYLFGDGAGACLISNDAPKATKYIKQHGFHSVLLPEGFKDMGWKIGAWGFEMILNRNIPGHLEKNIKDAFLQTLEKSKLNIKDLKHFAIHPGGKNILKAFKKALALDATHLENSYNILTNFGNMSSATIIFVLEAFLRKGVQGWMYSAAFGPGLSVESGIFKIEQNGH
jgi:alpha-pyrone synthase